MSASISLEITGNINIFLQRYYTVMGSWYLLVINEERPWGKDSFSLPFLGKRKKKSGEMWSPWTGMKMKVC